MYSGHHDLHTMITGSQIRAARKLLGWTPYRLAPRAGMGHTLLRQFEAGERALDGESAARLKAALEDAGVIFTVGGVKLRRSPRGGRVADQLNAEKDG
jgi:transcriptional regulator with XRE-family HTH domain